jgi:N-acetylgalactosamine-N,N'-diacetylbacillosaminyl-diphospho-undecaprenol 4-alpha-N-acetylgalactosaminyltransferase
MKSDYRELPEEKLKTVPAPFDIKAIRLKAKNRIEREDEKALFDNFNVIVMAGRLSWQKHYTLAIRSFQRLSAYEDYKLIILGSGPKEDEIESYIHQHGLEENVKLLGWKENIFPYLRRAEFFLLTSRFEGFARVIVEALACDLPVIATDCSSGPAEILDDQISGQVDTIKRGEYGMLANPSSVDHVSAAIQTLIEEKSLQQQYRRKALKRAKSYDKKKIAKIWLSLFDELEHT